MSYRPPLPSPYRLDFTPFADLRAGELHDVLKLRFDVFVLEQRSLYPEIDGADKLAMHGVVRRGDAPTPVATLRIEGLEGGDLTIGRVAVHPDHRGAGLGPAMIGEALDFIAEAAPGRRVTLGAQIHLEGLYGRFGFRRASDVYDDGGIPHVAMALGAEAQAAAR